MTQSNVRSPYIFGCVMELILERILSSGSNTIPVSHESFFFLSEIGSPRLTALYRPSYSVGKFNFWIIIDWVILCGVWHWIVWHRFKCDTRRSNLGRPLPHFAVWHISKNVNSDTNMCHRDFRSIESCDSNLCDYDSVQNHYADILNNSHPDTKVFRFYRTASYGYSANYGWVHI